MKKALILAVILMVVALVFWLWSKFGNPEPSILEVADREAIWVPYYLLVLRPEIYHGVYVRVIGKLTWEFEDTALWDLSENHPDGLPAIDLVYDSQVSQVSEGELAKLSGRVVTIEGVFFGGFPNH